MSESDFVNITHNGELCNAKGEIGILEFETIMRREVMSYLQTRLTDFSDFRTGEDMEFTHLGTLKTILSEVLVLVEEQRIAGRGIREMLGQMNPALYGAEQHNLRVIPDWADAMKALRVGMEALAVELVGVRAVIQEHNAALGRAGSTRRPAVPRPAELPPMPPRRSRANSCSPSMDSPASEWRSRQQLRGRGSFGSCNFEAGGRASSSPAGVPASSLSDCLDGSAPPAGSNTPRGPIQPAAGQLAGRQSLGASRSTRGRLPRSSSCNSTSACSATGEECAQGKKVKAPGGKRRSSAAAAATAATKSKNPSQDWLVLPKTGSDAAFKLSHGKASAERIGPSSSVALPISEEARGSVHSSIASSPATRPSLSHPRQVATASAVEGLACPLACPAPLASTMRRQFANEVVSLMYRT